MAHRLSIFLLFLVACGAASDIDSTPAAPEGPRHHDEASTHELGSGFVVWESNRSGAWRLWIRELGAGGARQLTAD